MKATIHQPCYLPYLGVFYKIWQADEFVYLDDAQYSNGYVFDWNRIKTPQGECRLKVPTARVFGQKLTEVTPKNLLKWREKHLKTVQMNYKKAPYFGEFFDLYKQILMEDYESLAALNIALMDMFMEWFGLHPVVHKSSDMNLETRSEARVIEICQRIGADEYISGTGGKNYQEEDHFVGAGIKLTYADYIPLAYPQQWGGFQANMSALDYAMNCGHGIDNYFQKCKEKEEARNLLRDRDWRGKE